MKTNRFRRTDAAYAVVLDALTQAIDDDERDFRNTDGCNFYSALSPTLSNLNTQLGADSASMDKDKATLGAMATKYGVAVKDLQTTELSPDDSLIVTPIYNRFKQTWRTLQYARDLIHIEGLFTVFPTNLQIPHPVYRRLWRDTGQD